MLGGHRSALWDSLIMAVAMALMVISFLLDRLPLLLLGLGLLGIGYGGMSSLCAALVRDLFGPRHYPQNLAIMSLQMVPASLLGPMLGSSLYTLSLIHIFGIASFQGQYDTNWGTLMAGAVMITVPVVIIFWLLQKHLVAGMTAGAVKG